MHTRLLQFAGLLLVFLFGRVTSLETQQAVQAQDTPSAINSVALGTGGNYNGFRPFLPSDTLNQEIYTAAVDTALTERMHSLLANTGLGFDTSMVPNVVDSTKQKVTWTLLVTPDGDQTMVPLQGDEQLESQSAGITPFTCWNDNPNVDHHLTVFDIGTGFLYDSYQTKMCSGQLRAESAKVWDTTIAYDGQNCIGCDSTDAAGLEPTFEVLNWQEVQQEIARGRDANGCYVGYVRHVQRFTLPHTSIIDGSHGGDVIPATHSAGQAGNPSQASIYGVFGSRFRLDPALDTCKGFAPMQQVILRGWQRYGLVLADNGRPGFQVYQDARWTQQQLDALDALKNVRFQHFSVLQAPEIFWTDTNDDERGSDSVKHGSYTQTCHSNTTSFAGNCSFRDTPVKLPYLRPTIGGFTATGGGKTSSRALTVPLGTSVTFTLEDTHSTVHYLDCAPPFRGNTVTLRPTQNVSCTAYARGTYGFTKGPRIVITVTGPTVATPAIRPAAGSYGSEQTVTLTSATPGATIHYTTSGEKATCFSPAYTAPLTIRYTSSISVIACSGNMLNSPVREATYTIKGSPVQLGAVNTSFDSNGDTPASWMITASNRLAGVFNIISATLLGYPSLAEPPAVPVITSSDGRTCAFIASAFTNANDKSGVWGNAAWACPNAPAGTITYTAKWVDGKGTYNPILHSYVWNGAAAVNAVEGGVGSGGKASPLECGTVVTTGTNEVIQTVGEVPYADVKVIQPPGFSKINNVGGAQSFYSPSVASPARVPVRQARTGGSFSTCVAFAIRHN